MSSELVPLGMVFDPTDDEILSIYLDRLIRVGGNVKAVLGEPFSDLILSSDVYSNKPSFYFSNDESHEDALYKGNQQLVFSPREKISQKSGGKRPKRGVKLHDGVEVGFWKSSTGDKSVLHRGEVIGFLNTLNYYEYTERKNGNGKRNRKDGTKKTDWLMYEYRLKGSDGVDDQFQKWVICKIKSTLRRKTDEDKSWSTQMKPGSDDPMSSKHDESHPDAAMEDNEDELGLCFSVEDIDKILNSLE